MHLIKFTNKDILIISVISSLSILTNEKNFKCEIIPNFFIVCFNSEYVLIL